MRVCEAAVTPKRFSFPSERTEEIYFTTSGTMFSEPTCTCKGYHYRGECKHVNGLKRCSWTDTRTEEEQERSPVEFCPRCGAEIIEFEVSR